MRLQQAESSGPATVSSQEKSYKKFEQHSSSLPFGQHVALSHLAGSIYTTPQQLVQQVAFLLSDRLWSYSPESFDLDVSLKDWFSAGEKNVHEYIPNVEAMQIRSGAASIALGYIFSKDFDLSKKYIPQSIIASTSSLQYLQASLDQLALLYSMASPFVAHIAAIDYQVPGLTGYVTDYVSALALADEIGLGVVSSGSANEAQHMSLFATLLASVLPTIHIYDGLKVGRDTSRIGNVLDQTKLKNAYQAILHQATKSSKRYDTQETKAVSLLKLFNSELGTCYKPFEYHGHLEADHVFVVFGTVEASLGEQIINTLTQQGEKVGLINVRVYRPFAEEEFLEIVPKSTKVLGVLGQVHDSSDIADSAMQSNLYRDVLAALTFAEDWKSVPSVIDIKYSREQVWTEELLLTVFKQASPKLPAIDHITAIDNTDSNSRDYVFWNLDETPFSKATAALAKALSKDSSSNVSFSTKHDNLVQGGIQRTDIRKSESSSGLLPTLQNADTVWVGSLDILKDVNVLASTKCGGSIILNCPGIKDNDIEKKLSPAFRQGIQKQKLKLYILDPDAIEGIADDEDLLIYLGQITFLRVAMPRQEMTGLWKLSGLNGNAEVLGSISEKLKQGLRLIEVPEEWAKMETDAEQPELLNDIKINSFTTFDKAEAEESTAQTSWTTIAKSLVFKEAYGGTASVRPDLTVPTWTVALKEHRRLTPETYDRNIMDLEFDLGDSGLKYNIGDSLGIHPCNDISEVLEFISSYGLNPNDIIETPVPDSPGLTRSNTVYQILRSQLDVFGRPGRQFYEALSEYATDAEEAKNLLTISQPAGAREFTRRAEVDTITYADILTEFPSAHPPFSELIRIIPALKRREYSIASCQKATPNSVHLMIVTVLWTDPRKRDRFGLATRYLNSLKPGDQVTISLKPSVMKLPPSSTDAIIMAGLGTGLAPFRAFVQYRAWEKAQGKEIGPVLLYMGSRHQREEYCYGEEWEAYRDAGVVTLLSCAFSRDQPQKIYIQDRMRETARQLEKAYFEPSKKGAFYLCGPTWPVPDVTDVIEEVITGMKKREGVKKINARREVETLKDDGRFVLEVY
ncbi:MAG: hypothetical protein GOMPHAMPRED_001498 [Gomphillus americanus]|uniref:assimilatory sulfite reductase (NADPH) n=1 Tax=Gomphillus americanus TaxID=1940652 RepID=A0A8H3ILT4_9LECA|nr:MAG: hypothetical protein GOMPHAMPRED_001498 [Gomphillus americanus]